MTLKQVIKIMEDQLKDNAIDDINHVKTLSPKQFNALAKQYAKQYIKDLKQ
jgi:hypothetical protein